jgi:Ca-activated chloride channel homolog
MLAPAPGETTKSSAKDLLLVLDRSGSMDGEKFQQAQAALRFILNHLNPEDRFYISTFSSSTNSFSNELSPASQADNALHWVNGLNAAGSTDINRALLEAAAVADPQRPTYLIFLTDGLPTEGELNNQEILNNLKKAAPTNLHLFSFGVGYDVDTFLLDSLSQDHQGLSTYVQPGEKLDEKLSAFYERISTPVLTNVKLDMGGLFTYDLYPSPLPDIFANTQMIVVGRYHEGGTFDIRLTGTANGENKTYSYPAQIFANDNRETSSSMAELPRLWATRKIGYLLSKIRLQGPDAETIQQIVKLSIRYGIVTPYTSYLVTEPMPLGAESQERVAKKAYEGMKAAPAAPSSGATAVESAAGQGALTNADQAAPPSAEESSRVRSIGTRSFVLNQDGVWMDTTFDPQKMKPILVPFLSDYYFSLAQSSPDLAAALALAERVVVVAGDKVYEIVPSDTPVQQPPALPNTPTPEILAATATPVISSQVPPAPTPVVSLPTNIPTSATMPANVADTETSIVLTATGVLLAVIVVFVLVLRRK